MTTRSVHCAISGAAIDVDRGPPLSPSSIDQSSAQVTSTLSTPSHVNLQLTGLFHRDTELKGTLTTDVIPNILAMLIPYRSVMHASVPAAYPHLDSAVSCHQRR